MIDFKVNYDLSDVHKKPFGFYYLQSIENKDARYEMVMTLKINTIKYPKNPTSPIITSTAISEK